jgi:hypothetical protein
VSYWSATGNILTYLCPIAHRPSRNGPAKPFEGEVDFPKFPPFSSNLSDRFKTDYCDITGEPDFVRDIIDAHHEQAKAVSVA